LSLLIIFGKLSFPIKLAKLTKTRCLSGEIRSVRGGLRNVSTFNCLEFIAKTHIPVQILGPIHYWMKDLTEI